MELLTKELREQLLQNGRTNANPATRIAGGHDFAPIVKLFTPDANCTWLITEADPEDSDILFGLCDLGMGAPELGTVRLSELEALRGPMRMKVERDLHFVAVKTISEYASEAAADGIIRA